MIEGSPVNVLDYGAVGDGVADDTSAFNAAIATQKAIYVPAGTYRVNKFDPIQFDGFSIYGDGPDSTTIKTFNATDDLFTFGAKVNLTFSPCIKDLSFTTSVTKTTGYLAKATRTFNFLIERVRLDGYFGVCDIISCQLTVLRDIHAVYMTPTTGKAISVRAENGVRGSNVLLFNFACDGGPAFPKPYAGLYVEDHDGIFIVNSQFNRFENGAVFAPPVNTYSDHFFCSNTSFDTSSIHGILFKDSAGFTRKLRFNNCWSGSNGQSGIHIEANANVNGLHFADGWIIGNYGYGIYFANAMDNFQLEGCTVTGNSRAAPNLYSGIYITDTSATPFFNNFQMIGNKIGYADDLIDTQKYGFEVLVGTGPQFSQFVTVGNDFTGNLTGGVFLASSGFPANRMIKSNVGFVTENTGYDVQLAANTSVTVTHGCAFTPAVGDISITAGTGGGSATFAYVDTITSTTFKINTNSAPTAGNLGWGWKVNIQ
jgi:hypothetical protein